MSRGKSVIPVKTGIQLWF